MDASLLGLLALIPLQAAFLLQSLNWKIWEGFALIQLNPVFLVWTQHLILGSSMSQLPLLDLGVHQQSTLPMIMNAWIILLKHMLTTVVALGLSSTTCMILWLCKARKWRRQYMGWASINSVPSMIFCKLIALSGFWKQVSKGKNIWKLYLIHVLPIPLIFTTCTLQQRELELRLVWNKSSSWCVG